MENKKEKIVIFAAGTGGHIYPGLSIAKELISKNVSVLWIGTKNGIENNIIEDSEIPIQHINFSGVRGKGLLSYVKLPAKLIISIFQAFLILKKYSPSVVLSMGGYISFPCVLASYFLKIPIVIHEQNIIFGLANNILRFVSGTVILGLPMNIKGDKYKFLGNPTRYENNEVIKKHDKNKKFNILVVGGSLGAKIFNEVIPQAVCGLIKITDNKINIIHQTGKTYKIAEMQYNNFDVNVDLREYIDAMEKAYDWCDVIICRGGAITITEIMNLGIPSIIIPYPYATDDHQMKNCKYLENHNAAIVINQNNFSPDYLTNLLKTLIENKSILKSLSENITKLNIKNSTKNICEEVISKMSNN